MLRKLGLLALGLGVATLCWFALGSQRAGQLISMEEGRAIYGADEDCGDWKTNPTGGCQPNIYGWGLKFWESCPQTESLVSGTSYKVYTRVYSCVTTCGYHCGQYTSGYRRCDWGPTPTSVSEAN